MESLVCVATEVEGFKLEKWKDAKGKVFFVLRNEHGTEIGRGNEFKMWAYLAVVVQRKLATLKERILSSLYDNLDIDVVFVDRAPVYCLFEAGELIEVFSKRNDFKNAVDSKKVQIDNHRRLEQNGNIQPK